MKMRKTETNHSILPEVLLAGLLFTGLIVTEVLYINHREIDGAGFYELCRIQIGTEPPRLEYGLGELYARLLYGLFWLFGNRLLYGAYLQMALLTAALILFYWSIRSLCGYVPALAAVLGVSVFPTFLRSLTVLNQESLLVFILCVNLAVSAVLLNRTMDGETESFGAAGLLTAAALLGGFSCYLDKLYLAVPAVVLLVLLFAKRPYPSPLIKLRRLQLPCYLAGLCAGFALCFFMDRSLSGRTYSAVWAEYGHVQLDGGIFLSGDSMHYVSALMLFLVFTVAAAGLAGYGYFKKERGMAEENEIRIQDIEHFEREAPPASAQTEGQTVTQVSEQAGEPIEAKVSSEAKEQIGKSEAPEAKKVVQYIENPLPVPKRHVKKEMSYGFEPEPSMMKYDVDVPDNDDFDLS